MTPSDQSDSNPPSQEEVSRIGRSYSDGLIVLDSRRRPRPLEALLEREPSETTFLDRQYNGEDADEEGEGESEVEGEGSKDTEGYLPERSAPIAIQVCLGVVFHGLKAEYRVILQVELCVYAACRDGLQMFVCSFIHSFIHCITLRGPLILQLTGNGLKKQR